MPITFEDALKLPRERLTFEQAAAPSSPKPAPSSPKPAPSSPQSGPPFPAWVPAWAQAAQNFTDGAENSVVDALTFGLAPLVRAAGAYSGANLHDRVTGGPGVSWKDSIGKVRADSAQFAAAHPVVDAVSGFVGGMINPLTKAKWVANTVLNVGQAGVQGALDTIGTDADMAGNAEKNAGIAALLSAVIPGGAKTIHAGVNLGGWAGRKLGDFVGTNAGQQRSLGNAARDAGVTSSSLRADMAANPSMLPVEVLSGKSSLTNLAEESVGTGAVKDRLVADLEARQTPAMQTDRLEAAVRDNVGPPGAYNPVESYHGVRADLEARKATEPDAWYQAAYTDPRNARIVDDAELRNLLKTPAGKNAAQGAVKNAKNTRTDVSPVDDELTTALKEARDLGLLTDKEIAAGRAAGWKVGDGYTLAHLHNVEKQLTNALELDFKAGKLPNGVKDVRDDLRKFIEKMDATGGLKKGRELYSGLSGEIESLDLGRAHMASTTTTASDMNAAMRPFNLKDMTPRQQELYRVGAGQALIDDIHRLNPSAAMPPLTTHMLDKLDVVMPGRSAAYMKALRDEQTRIATIQNAKAGAAAPATAGVPRVAAAIGTALGSLAGLPGGLSLGAITGVLGGVGGRKAALAMRRDPALIREAMYTRGHKLAAILKNYETRAAAAPAKAAKAARTSQALANALARGISGATR